LIYTFGMKEFRLFDISDFVMDEDFIRWVSKREKSDNDFWKNWLRQHPDKHMVVAEARRILESISTEQTSVSEHEVQSEIDRLLHTIKEQKQLPTITSQRTSFNKWWYAVAATIMLALAGTAVFVLHNGRNAAKKYTYELIAPSKGLIENVNTSEKTVTVKLPDGSTVNIAPHSRIGYTNNFDNGETRDIYLSGEAFFTVTKNPARPFRVFANEIVTKVLGTSFRVRSFEKDTVIQVTVRTGKVSVYSQTTAGTDIKEISQPNHLGGIILTPNQEVVYQKEKEKFQKVLLDNPLRIRPEPPEQSMLYEDAPIEKVFREVADNYGISIVYDNDILKKCTVTADLRKEPFYNQLMLVCKAIGASYEIIDGQIVIQSNGCE
jgi:transmembrane sensor